MKKTIARLIMTALCVLPFAAATSVDAATTWNVTGSHVIKMYYGVNMYGHDMILVQDSAGNLTGNGGHPPGSNVYSWTITSGTVSGDTIEFWANYTAPSDATSPLTTMHVIGTIHPDGSMSGTWDDNYQGNYRTDTWESVGVIGVHDTTPPATTPTTADSCKKDGWKTFNTPTFKNQGECVSYVQSNENAGKRL